MFRCSFSDNDRFVVFAGPVHKLPRRPTSSEDSPSDTGVRKKPAAKPAPKRKRRLVDDADEDEEGETSHNPIGKGKSDEDDNDHHDGEGESDDGIPADLKPKKRPSSKKPASSKSKAKAPGKSRKKECIDQPCIYLCWISYGFSMFLHFHYFIV